LPVVAPNAADLKNKPRLDSHKHEWFGPIK
jgi:hypothetical protein